MSRDYHIPDGYQEKQRERINAELRTDLIERIDHRNFLMGFGHDVERATRQFDEQILESGMSFDEANQVLHVMHHTNMKMVKRASIAAAKKI